MSKKKFKKENIESGRRVKYARINKGMTQEAFADEIGISPSALKKIESGENGVSTRVLRKLMDIDISSDYILEGARESFERILFEVDNRTAEEKMELFVKLLLEYTRDATGRKLSKAQVTDLIGTVLGKDN